MIKKNCFLFFFSVLSLTCGKKYLKPQEIDNLINQYEKQDVINIEDRVKVSKTKISKEIENGKYYEKREETASYEKLFEDQSVIDISYKDIYPGSLVLRSSVDNGSPVSSKLKVVPMKISLNIAGSDSISEDSVDCNSSGSVYTAINKILKKNKSGYQTGFYSLCAIANTFEDATFKLDLNGSWIGGNLRSKLQTNTSKENTNIYFLLKDHYYQAYCEPPKGVPSNLFRNTLQESDKTFLAAGTEPLLITSVTYGRMLLFKGSISNETIRNKVEADIEQDFMFGSVDANMLISKFKKYNVKSFEILVNGGFKKINTGEDFEPYLKEIIEKGNTPSQESPGFPLSFRTTTLKGATYSVRSTITDYVRTNWNVIPEIEILCRINKVTNISQNSQNIGMIRGSFLVNSNLLWPVMDNNLSFGDTHISLPVGNSVNFVSKKESFCKIPLDIKGHLIVSGSLALDVLFIDNSNLWNGVQDFLILDLLKEQTPIIKKYFRCKSIKGIPGEYQVDYEIILDPKNTFKSLYDIEISSYISKFKPL